MSCDLLCVANQRTLGSNGFQVANAALVNELQMYYGSRLTNISMDRANCTCVG